jgi:hypothetical protein
MTSYKADHCPNRTSYFLKRYLLCGETPLLGEVAHRARGGEMADEIRVMLEIGPKAKKVVASARLMRSFSLHSWRVLVPCLTLPRPLVIARDRCWRSKSLSLVRGEQVRVCGRVNCF